jgi:hypothetical protein
MSTAQPLCLKARVAYREDALRAIVSTPSAMWPWCQQDHSNQLGEPAAPNGQLRGNVADVALNTGPSGH